jgi:hypothetical protein
MVHITAEKSAQISIRIFSICPQLLRGMPGNIKEHMLPIYTQMCIEVTIFQETEIPKLAQDKVENLI